jgi:hypothetical protein
VGLFLSSKTPFENSGTPEPATSPVIPHFPHPPILEVIIFEKYGTGPELFNDFRWVRMRSNIAMLRRPKAGWDVAWDAAGTSWRDIPATSPVGFKDKEEFYRAVFFDFFLVVPESIVYG